MTVVARPPIGDPRQEILASAQGRSRRIWNPIARYTRWLHTMWPAGVVEKLPEVNADGSTRIPGVYVVGDLTGIPLLKFSSDTGARAVKTILSDPGFHRSDAKDLLDLVI